MLDYNTKFDRREPTAVLDVEEIRELVRSRLGGCEIESVSVLTGVLLIPTIAWCSKIIVLWF
jgi:hypothetical protein